MVFFRHAISRLRTDKDRRSPPKLEHQKHNSLLLYGMNRVSVYELTWLCHQDHSTSGDLGTIQSALSYRLEMTDVIKERRKDWMASVAFAALMLLVLSVSGTNGQTPEPVIRESERAASAFISRIDSFIGTVGLQREAYSVRVNHCEGGSEPIRDDIYYIWIGLRGIAPHSNAAELLEEVHSVWQAEGWNIFRYRKFANGGVNLGARDPRTGDTFTLDSGFRADPDRYVVGYFSTPCFRAPSGTADFGAMWDSR